MNVVLPITVKSMRYLLAQQLPHEDQQEPDRVAHVGDDFLHLGLYEIMSHITVFGKSNLFHVIIEVQ